MVGDREIGIIDSLVRRFRTADPDVVVGIGDDAAVVRRDKRSYWLLTADMLVESVHFGSREDRARVGYKAMAVSVSDIAAMGGEPRYALVSVAVPRLGAERTMAALARGMARAARKFGFSIIGGDTNRGAHLTIDVAMMGVVPHRRLVLRRGARNGDALFVTGPLGGSRRGRHLDFEPRVQAAHFLTRHFRVHAMIDLSDGLAKDLGRVARASGLGAVLDEDAIPVRRGARGTRAALYEGEDFELLFALSGKDAQRLRRWSRRTKIPLGFHPVGRMDSRLRGVWLADRKGQRRRVPEGGFTHF